MMDHMNTATGRCLCGAITFRVSGELTVEDDGSNLRWYAPVPEAQYGFCAQCGSSLFWGSPELPDTVSICAGALDPPTHLRTTQAWWTLEASDYHCRPDLLELETE